MCGFQHLTMICGGDVPRCIQPMMIKCRVKKIDLDHKPKADVSYWGANIKLASTVTQINGLVKSIYHVTHWVNGICRCRVRTVISNVFVVYHFSVKLLSVGNI